MHVQFIGAAGTVTGSMHVLDTGNARILLDCGLYQGRRAEANEINKNFRVDPKTIDLVVLSHAHIDHAGLLPLLVAKGFSGKVISTPATCALLDPMLRDSARVQKGDADFINRRNERHGLDEPIIEPLYRESDVEKLLILLSPLAYRTPTKIAEGVTLTFYDAGHVLGSAISVFEIANKHGEASKKVVFTGDLGRRNAPILEDPELVNDADLLIMESTYGDRLHEPVEQMDEQLAELIETTLKKRGKVLIPSFALERAQEVLHAITRLQKKKRLPSIPIFLDSPLTIKLTHVFSKYSDCFDAETMGLIREGRSPFEPDNLRYVESITDSRTISESSTPCVVISASGMLEAGRVLHHLRAIVDDPKSVVALVGYQAQNTLGRRLLEGRTRVKIFGIEFNRSVRVEPFSGFSAHADQADLLSYANEVKRRGRVGKIALVHGEAQAQSALAGLLREQGHKEVLIPQPYDKTDIL